MSAIVCKDRDFEALMQALRTFKVYAKPITEHELENKLCKFLEAKGIAFTRQKATKTRINRYDVEVRIAGKRYLIELKRYADRSNVDQLDRYLLDCNGLILLCWHASPAMRAVMELGKAGVKVPLGLIEVQRQCSFA